MTAGKGIVHSEMPASDGDNIGLQLWINLKAKDKVRRVDGYYRLREREREREIDRSL